MVYRITTRIGPEARTSYHVASNDEIMRAIETRAVSLLVVGAWMKEFYAGLSPSETEAFHALVDANYSLVSKIGDIEVYRRRSVELSCGSPDFRRAARRWSGLPAVNHEMGKWREGAVVTGDELVQLGKGLRKEVFSRHHDKRGRGLLDVAAEFLPLTWYCPVLRQRKVD